MSESTKIADTTANPAPLGLLGFGMTTVLLNLANAGIYNLGSMILAMGFFYGGLAQIFAGWMEWKKGNTFGLTAFTSYGLFWETLVFLILMPSWGGSMVQKKEPWLHIYLCGAFLLLLCGLLH